MIYFLLILTGASGSGKTEIVEYLKTASSLPIQYFHFDSVGVPTREEMVSQYGSGELWQLAMTKQWISEIKNVHLKQTHVVLEGQMRISYIIEALKENKLSHAKMILIDCTSPVRKARLIENRNQPELATEEMMNWASYLRSEAEAYEVPVLDTSELSVRESARSAIETSKLSPIDDLLAGKDSHPRKQGH
jgi:dephospho-CoA kinase